MKVNIIRLKIYFSFVQRRDRSYNKKTEINATVHDNMHLMIYQQFNYSSIMTGDKQFMTQPYMLNFRKNISLA